MVKNISELLSLFESAYTSVHDAIAKDPNELANPQNITTSTFAVENANGIEMIDFATVMHLFDALRTSKSMDAFQPTPEDIDAINALCSDTANVNQSPKAKFKSNFTPGSQGQRDLCIVLAKNLGDDGSSNGSVFREGLLNGAKKFGQKNNYIDTINNGEVIFESFNTMVYTQCMSLTMMKIKGDSEGKITHEEVDGGDDERVEKVAVEYIRRYNSAVESYIADFINSTRADASTHGHRTLDALNEGSMLPKAGFLCFILNEYSGCYTKSPEEISRYIGKDILENYIESNGKSKHIYDMNQNAASTANSGEDMYEYQITPENMEGATNCLVYPRTITDIIRIPDASKIKNIRGKVRNALNLLGVDSAVSNIFCDKVLSTKENNVNDFIKSMPVNQFIQIVKLLYKASQDVLDIDVKVALFVKNARDYKNTDAKENAIDNINIDELLNGTMEVGTNSNRKSFVVGPSSKEGSAMEDVSKYNKYKYGNAALSPMPTNKVNNQTKKYVIAYPGSVKVAGEGLSIELTSGQKITLNEDDIRGVNSHESKMSDTQFAYPFHRENGGDHWICLLQDGIAFVQMTDAAGNTVRMADASTGTGLGVGEGSSAFNATDAGQYINAVKDGSISGKFKFSSSNKNATAVYTAAAKLMKLYNDTQKSGVDIGFNATDMNTLLDIFQFEGDSNNSGFVSKRVAILKTYETAIMAYAKGQVTFDDGGVQMYNPESGRIELSMPEYTDVGGKVTDEMITSALVKACESDISDIALGVYAGSIAAPTTRRMDDGVDGEASVGPEPEETPELSQEGYDESESDVDESGILKDDADEISEEDYRESLYHSEDIEYPHNVDDAVGMVSDKLNELVGDRIGKGRENNKTNTIQVYEELEKYMNEVGFGLKKAMDDGVATAEDVDGYDMFAKFVRDAYEANGEVANYVDFVKSVRGVIQYLSNTAAKPATDEERANRKSATLSSLNTVKFRTLLNRKIKNDAYKSKYEKANPYYKDALRAILDEIAKYAPEVIQDSDVDSISPSFMRSRLASKKALIQNDVKKALYNAKSKAGKLTAKKSREFDSTFDDMFNDMADFYGQYAEEGFENPTFRDKVEGQFDLREVPEPVNFDNIGLSVPPNDVIRRFLTFTLEGGSTELVKLLAHELKNDVKLYGSLTSYVDSLDQSKLKIDGIRASSSPENLIHTLESLVTSGYCSKRDAILKNSKTNSGGFDITNMHELKNIMETGELPAYTEDPNNPFLATPVMDLLETLNRLAGLYNSSVSSDYNGQSTTNKETRARKYFENDTLNEVVDIYREYIQMANVFNTLNDKQMNNEPMTAEDTQALSVLGSKLGDYKTFLTDAANSVAHDMYNILISVDILLLTAVKYISESIYRSSRNSMDGKMPVAGFDANGNPTRNTERSNAPTKRRESNLDPEVNQLMGLIKIADKSSRRFDRIEKILDYAKHPIKNKADRPDDYVDVRITDLMSSSAKYELYKETLLPMLRAFNDAMLQLINREDYSEIADGVTEDYATKLYGISNHSKLMRSVSEICKVVRKVFMSNGKIDEKAAKQFASICNYGKPGFEPKNGNDAVYQGILDICGGYDGTNDTLSDFIDDVYNTTIHPKDFKEKYEKTNIIDENTKQKAKGLKENVVSNSAEMSYNLRKVIDILVKGTDFSNNSKLSGPLGEKIKKATELLLTTERVPEAMKGLMNYFRFRQSKFDPNFNLDITSTAYDKNLSYVLNALIEQDKDALENAGNTAAVATINSKLASGDNRAAVNQNLRSGLAPVSASPSYQDAQQEKQDIQRAAKVKDFTDTVDDMMNTLVEDWKKRFDKQNTNGNLKWDEWLAQQVHNYYAQLNDNSVSEEEILNKAKQVKV